MGTVEQTALYQTSDEDLAAQYLAIRNSGRCGSQAYQCVEAEMRRRGLIREARFETSYTSSRSSFSPRGSMFSSF